MGRGGGRGGGRRGLRLISYRAFITYFLCFFRARPSMSLGTNWRFIYGYIVYLYFQLVGVKTNRPTIVSDLHRTLKGLINQSIL